MQEQSSRIGGVSVHGNRRRRSLAFICWLVFAVGLLVQLLSPHLNVPNGAFVIPPQMATGITPTASRAVLVMGCCTSGNDPGVGQVSLQHILGNFIEWVGLESPSSAAITSSSSNVAGTHIVFIDFTHKVDVQVNSADTIRVHNGSTGTLAGNVTLIW